MHESVTCEIIAEAQAVTAPPVARDSADQELVWAPRVLRARPERCRTAVEAAVRDWWLAPNTAAALAVHSQKRRRNVATLQVRIGACKAVAVGSFSPLG